MALLTVDFHTKSLARRTRMDVFIPSLNLGGCLKNRDVNYYQNNNETYPLIIFLHGFGDNEKAWQMNTQNSKLAYVIGADGKSQAKTFEQLFDKIQSGVPAVATGANLWSKDGKPLWEAFSTNLRQNFIAPEISIDMRSIMAEFDSFVGIPSNPNSTKKERQIVDEVNANNIETDTILDLIVETLNDGFSRVNARYGLNCSASKKYPVVDKEMEAV